MLDGVVDRVFRAFSSRKLTVANLLAISFAMAAWTFTGASPMASPRLDQALAGRPLALRAYRVFELYDLRSSWWFTLLLLTLALNLIAISIERLPRIWLEVTYPEKRLDRLRGLRLRASGRPLTDVVAELRRRRYRVTVQPRDGGSDVFAERGRVSRFGTCLVPLSLVVLLGGGIAGRLTAFDGAAFVPQNGGEEQYFTVRAPDGSTSRKRLGFTIRCTDFRAKDPAKGAPGEYESDLVLLDGEQGELGRATISADKPLRFAGLTIAQSGYRELEDGLRARLRLVDRASGAASEVLLGPGEKIEAAEGSTYSVVDYREDFAGLGEAVQVLREQAGAQPSRSWIFRKASAGSGQTGHDDRVTLSFAGMAQLYATGLQIGRDPCVPVLYAGCLLLLLGCAIGFGTTHRRIWARIAAERVDLGGAARGNAAGFQLEFESICAALGLKARGRGAALAA